LKILIAIHSPFVMWRIPPGHVERLRRTFPSHSIVFAREEAHAIAEIRDADIVLSAQVTRSLFAAAERLRWIHSPAAGIGGMLFPELVESDVVLTNSRAMSSDTIAEHVLAVTLAMFRRLPDAWRSQAAREWAQNAIGVAGNRLIGGSRVIVIGLGGIGSAVARRMRALGAEVTGVRRTTAPAPSGVSTLVTADRLHDVLPSADVVVIAAPHTQETRALIGARELSLMAPHALLVNVSRGHLIDEQALIEALRIGAIGGAALDVFVDEPLAPDSPFWTLPNVLITPHTSGFRPDHWDAVIDLFSNNLRRFERGEALINVVDKIAGY
jgi:phosphoglycerate dehydrogenase-like enzyme